MNERDVFPNDEALQWTTVSRRPLLSAPPWLEVAVEDVQLPGGKVVRDFYRVTLPDFAVIVAQTKDGDVVAEHQYKHGIGRASLLLPAGLVDPGESPLAAARRELLEETGFASAEWQALGAFVVDGNRGCGRAHVFLARNAARVADPHADEAEPLEVRLLPCSELLGAALGGGMLGLAHMAAFMLAYGAGLLQQGLRDPA